MSSKLEKLMFQIGVLDKASAPIAKIQKQLDSLTNKATAGIAKVAGGTAGLAGSAYTAMRALQPARDIAAKIGEVASLDVGAAELKVLEQTALQATATYGGSAAEFIGASYDIQSAISGLEPGQLGKVTDAMNTLAIATKADVANMTSLMGSMYGIFEDQAITMGVDNFSQKVAAVTAKSVQMFKTTGKAMEDAFRGVGSLAKTHGIAMEEQFAVLGTLQATMPGAEAGTKYKAFLAGVMKAQDKLGMKFTNAQGQMLPMVDILDKIKGKYGELDSGEIADLSKAFGSQEAVMVLTSLIGKTDKLKTSIDDVAGADFALVADMANKIADPWDKAGASINGLTAKLGGLFLPTVNAGMDKVAGFVSGVMEWVDANPELAKTLGKVGIGIFAVIAGLSALAIVIGVAQLAMAGFGAVMALAFSPVTLIVLGIAALAAGAVYLYTKWDSIKASLADTSWGQLLLATLDAIMSPVETFHTAIDQLSSLWNNTRADLSDTAWGQVLLVAIDALLMPFNALKLVFTALTSGWEGVKASLSDTEWGQAILALIDKLSAGFKAVAAGWNSVKGFASEKYNGVKSFFGFGGDDKTSGAVEKLPVAGGRAVGGLVQAGKVYEVNERVPELLMQGGRTYLLNDMAGRVAPLVAANDALSNVVNLNDHRQQAEQPLRDLVSQKRTGTDNLPAGGIREVMQTRITNRDRLNTAGQARLHIGSVNITVNGELDAEKMLHELEMLS